MLPEGLDVGLGSDCEAALDDERAQPAGGGDRVPQRLPETLPALLVGPGIDAEFFQGRPHGGDERAQVLRGKVLESSVEHPVEVQLLHRAGAPLGPCDDPRGVDSVVAKRSPPPKSVRHGPRPLELISKVDLERPVQRARIPGAVELGPLLADQGEGAPHPVVVPDRSKDRHEQLLREVSDVFFLF